MNPLLPLGTLTTDVEHTVGEITDNERRFGDTRGLDTGTKDILVGREVVTLRDALDGIEVAGWLVSH